MKSDRIGLLLIAASLLAIAVVGGLVYRHEMGLHEEKTRIQGLALTRALSGIESDRGEPAAMEDGPAPKPADAQALMRNLVGIQDNKQFAYVVISDPAGRPMQELAAPGSLVPPAAMPVEPFAWFGEHALRSPGDGRPVREFFAPIVRDGQLTGFARAGFYTGGYGVPGEKLSTFALLALPIFLLTTLSYLLIRREIRPLGELSEKMERATQSIRADGLRAGGNVDLGEFVQRFDRFLQVVQSRAQQMSTESLTSQASVRALAFKQEKAEAALNSLQDGVLLVDASGMPTFANQRLGTILGADRASIVGKSPQQWCANKDVLAFLLRFGNAGAPARQATMEYTPENAADRRIAAVATPLFSARDGDTRYGTLIVFRDTSAEFQARQAGAEFVSHVAHELKTPLNTMAAYSELLLEISSLPEADAVDAVNVIHGEVERMAGLINNLLNIARMESGTLQLDRKRVRLHEVVEDAFASMRSNAMGKNIELELAIPPDLGAFRLDKSLFRIALDNLLSNAIKYSNPGGKVTVSAGMLDDGRMQIRVRDRGIGISRADCDKVFAKYYRVASAETESRSGHGLGLYLAKQIIEMHSGTITVDSEPGVGTEFIITFKAQPMQLKDTETQ